MSVAFKDCTTENIVKEIPEALREEFEAFIMKSSGDDPTIGMGGLVLKKEWFDAFKSHYKNRSS